MASETKSSDQQMRAVVERIDTLVRDFDNSPDPAIRRQAQELVRLLMQLYGAGLMRILAILELEDVHAGRRSGETLAALLADDLIASLLVLHDLHPEDVDTRIARSLERVGPAVGASITLLGVGDGIARVKLEAPRQAAAHSLLDLQRLVESVVHAVAPDIVRVDVEGLPRTASVPLTQLMRKPVADRSRETRVP